MSNKRNSPYKIISQNRKARHNYEIGEEFEAGICLVGSEVKSLRVNNCNIAESFVEKTPEGELFLINSHIAKYEMANVFTHSPTRKRKLLLKRREINKITKRLKEKGETVVPLVIYFNDKNKVKIKIAMAKGKNTVDKRKDIKARDIQRYERREAKY